MNAKVQELKTLEIPPQITVRDLAGRLEISPVELLKALIANGIMATITQTIDYETAAIVAEDLGFALHLEGTAARAAERAEAEGPPEAEAVEETPGIPWYLADEAEADLAVRPPIVTVMGHVDHGKTSLLDAVRKSKVAAGESGGITQHIGAYQVVRDGQPITFIDTPGHEAFTAMRARGARATDIAVIVVAADDGVMPQTREALDHAKAAGVPIIVAMNKIDLPAAKPDRIQEQMAELGIVPDAWGGDYFFIPVSATTGAGIDELLDAILLVAESEPPMARVGRAALGTVLEGRVEQGRGVVATLLVQSGTLRRGDFVVADTLYGRVRAMFDEAGKKVDSAGPATPVEVMGLPEVPPAGSRFIVVPNEKAAKEVVTVRLDEQRSLAISGPEIPLTLDELFAQAAEGRVKALNLVVKTDVQGTVEPVAASLSNLSGAVKVNVLHTAAGDVSESDVNLAAASNAIVIAFRVSPDAAARRAAANRGVEIREYDVIYKLVEDVQDALTGMLDPVYEDKEIGRAEVRAIFGIPRQGNVAGCYVLSGVIRRNANVRVLRDGEELATSPVGSLRRFTEDVREVREGFECGVGLSQFDAFKEGDILVFTVRERSR